MLFFLFLCCFVKATKVLLLSTHAFQALAPPRLTRWLIMVAKWQWNDILVSRDEKMIRMISIPKHVCNNYVVF
uniref:Putative secreted peptide n=1 Tax=Anopheles braziliensis TaxID=58242 RepID=A0A2M3ZSW2_9DIPT